MEGQLYCEAHAPRSQGSTPSPETDDKVSSEDSSSSHVLCVCVCVYFSSHSSSVYLSFISSLLSILHCSCFLHQFLLNFLIYVQTAQCIISPIFYM